MYRVLIVEDDKNLAELLSIHLSDMDCAIDIANEGNSGQEKAVTGKYDLIVLDLMLPGVDGIAICQRLRALDNHTPILMLTAKSEEFDKVLGLESGADDYITKPFGVREFIARVKAILRRQELNSKGARQGDQLELIRIGDLEIDREKRRVIHEGERIALTPKEFDLLVLLATNPGRSYTRDQLLNSVWGYDFNGYEHTVNSHINRLRSKIEPDINSPTYILTTWGIGYCFNDDIT